VNPHLRMANFWFPIFGCTEWDLVALVAFRAEMASNLLLDVCVRLVEDHPFLCAFSVSGDWLLCHFGKEDSRPCGYDKS